MDDPRTPPLLAAIGLGVMLSACAAAPVRRAAQAPPSPAAESTQVAPAQPRALEQRLERSLAVEAVAGAVEPVPERKPCVVDVHVIPGGVVLSYAAPGSPDQAAQQAVQRMAAQHNRHQTENADANAAVGSVRSLALVENVRGGSRVTLIADDALDLADLYAHLASDAPDLMPSGSLERSLCEPPRHNATATVR